MRQTMNFQITTSLYMASSMFKKLGSKITHQNIFTMQESLAEQST